jgi:hypothetical protein
LAEKQTYKRVHRNGSEAKANNKEASQKKSGSKGETKTKTGASASKGNQNPNKEPNYMALILTFGIIGFVIFLSIIMDILSRSNGETVIVGSLTKPIMGLFGICTPAIGAYSFIYAYFCYKYKTDSRTKAVKGVLLFFNVFFLLGTLHLINGIWTDIPVSVKDFWSFGINWKGCGVIGGYIGWFLGKLLHVSIGLIFSIIAYAFCLILFFDGSPVNVSKGMGRKTKSVYKRLAVIVKQKFPLVKRK